MNNTPLVLLHGWGFSSRIWQPLLHALHDRGCTAVFSIDLPGFGTAFHEPCATYEQLLHFIVEQLPEKCALGGWSLGGMLALQIAARHPEKITHVITMGSNLHFTQDQDWPGMEAENYAQFCQRFAAQPQKTWQRFLALQTRGEAHIEQTDQQLSALADFSDLQPHTAERLLAMLGEIDNRTSFAALPVPGLHFLAERDAITPVSIAAPLRHINPQQRVTVLHECGHAFPLSQPQQLAEQIHHFLNTQIGHFPSRANIARSFSRAATSYNHAARLQKTVSEALVATLPAQLTGNIIDLGCGTGFISQALQKKSPSTTIFSIDLAAGMLQQARQLPAFIGAQADMTKLPLSENSADWLLSSLALQWIENPLACFQEWRRVLTPGGQLLFATLLPGTLHELQQCWQCVDDRVHINRFIAQPVLLQALRDAGFTHIDELPAKHTLYYPQLHDLAQELKNIGAHNMNSGRPKGLTGKQRWAQLIAHYETLRTDRGLPATYEVLYVTAH